MDNDQEKNNTLSDLNTGLGSEHTDAAGGTSQAGGTQGVAAQDADHMSAEPIEAPVATLPSAGEMLKSLRVAAGVGVATLASGLKVSSRKIEALEADHLENLPDLVFARGLAASACRYLGVGNTVLKTVLMRMPSLLVQDVDLDSTTPEKRTEVPESTQHYGSSKLVTSKALLALLVISLLIAVVYFFPKGDANWSWLQWLGGPSTEATQFSPTTTNESVGESLSQKSAAAASSMPAAPLTTPVSALNGESSESVPTTVSDSAVLSSTDSVADSVADAVPAESGLTAAAAPVLEAEAGPKPEVDSALQPEPSAGTGVLTIHASNETWVSLREANGGDTEGKTYNRLLKPGESMDLPEGFTLPVRVTIGYAQGTTVMIHGEVFDLDAVAKSNVARFEVE